MLKTDNWPELIKGAIISLLAVVPVLIAFVLGIRSLIKGWVDTAKEKSVGREALEKHDKKLDELEEKIRENSLLRGEVADLKRTVEALREKLEKYLEKQMEIWMRGKQ